ncbi:MAG TPA: hypothetical protein VNT75_31665, partial [Symbiobacteriaceae bacterium]|nr:hypothetical protein [Symbiobacteriaceae bacterium]
IAAAAGGGAEEAAAAARTGELEALEGALAQAERGRANLLGVLEQGLLPADEAAASLGRIRARIASLFERRAALLAAPPAAAVSSDTVLSGLADLRERRIPFADQKRLVRDLVAGVTVDGRRAVVHARWPAIFAGGTY